MDLIASADEEKADIDVRCGKIHNFLHKSKLTKLLNMGPEYFRQWYAKVNMCTFADCLPYKFMHPLTDLLNHAANDANCSLFVYNDSLQKRGTNEAYNKQSLPADMQTVLPGAAVYRGDNEEQPQGKLLSQWQDELRAGKNVWEIDYTHNMYEDDDDEEESD